MAPRKAESAQLTRGQIVAAAMRLIDRDGLEAQSMRALGAELGVDPSTVYYYVPGKAALYDLVVDEVLSAVDLSVDDPSASFEDRVVAAGLEYRRALLLHPRAVPLVAVRSLRTPAQLAVIEGLSHIFFDAGFSAAEALLAMDTCGLTIVGMTGMHAARLAASGLQEPATASADSAGGLAADRYPNVTRMLAAAGTLDESLEFERAMRALARGLLALHLEGALGNRTPDGAGAHAPGGE